MKKIYWRPQKISSRVLFLIFLTSVVCYITVLRFDVKKKLPHFKDKIAAAKLAQNAFELVKEERLRKNIPIDSESDPGETGLIGTISSPVTTNSGYLPAKRTSVNPNFAAVVVQYLKSLGIKKDDVVAVGISGSFPAMNIAVYSAIETLGAKAIVVSSAGSSQWGANTPGFLWPDIENLLFSKKVFSIRADGVTLGGIDDKALGLSADGKKIMEDSITSNGYNFLKVKNYPDSLEKKMTLYRELAGDRPIKAYVNVGGGTTSVGTKLGKFKFHSGINKKLPIGTSGIDSVMTRLVQEGVPVIHLTKVDELSTRYGFPEQPKTMPKVGEGKIYTTEEPNKLLAAIALVVIFSVLYVLVRLDWGFRLFGVSSPKKNSYPEQMV